jgi:hypothetical protein
MTRRKRPPRDDVLRRAAVVAAADPDPRWAAVAAWLRAVAAQLDATALPDWHEASEPQAFAVARVLLTEDPR